MVSPHAMTAIEILPGKLSWTSESVASLSSKGHDVGVEILSVSDLCDCKVKVMHYSEEALGRTAGPLSLWQTLSFCQALHSKLELCKVVILATPFNFIAERSNTAVFLGAYLALYLKWTTSRIISVVGELDADRLFVHSWARVDQPKPKCVLTVRDCWEGFQWAQELGWIDPHCFADEKSISEACTKCQQMVARYDAAWIVPGRVLVCADPMTTALDPSPSTFCDLFPATNCEDSIENKGTPSEETGSTTLDGVETCDEDSCDTVCKDYDDIRDRAVANLHRPDSAPVDFVTFLKACGVDVIIRANLEHEAGLLKSYDPFGFVSQGFHFEDMQIIDKRGGLPSKSDVRRLLDIYDSLVDEQGKAIMIHCKGGFGRSITLACCLAIARFGIPPRAALAWVRIARPGSVTCPQQEEFITSFREKATVAQPQCCCTQ